MVIAAQVGANRRVVVSALDDVIIETVPEAAPAAGEVRVRSSIVDAVGTGVDEAWMGTPVVI